jgi:AAHS family 4-hydroxybenzoate transporter-like MFS transporter
MAFWRLISGLGFGSAYANAIALTGEWLPDRWRSVGVTTLSVGTPAGGMVVSAMAPTILESYGWRGSFVFLGLLTFLVVILIIAFLKDSPTFLIARGKMVEAKKAAKKITSDALELVAERHDTDTATGSIGVLDRSNLRLNIGVGMAFTAATMVAYGVLLWTTTMLTAKGFGLDQASYAVAFAGLTSIFASIAAGLIIQQLGSKLTMTIFSGSLFVTLILLTISLESLSGGTPTDSERMLVVGLLGLAAALFSASIASMYAIMTHAYPPSCRSAGIGFGIFMGRFGAIGSSGLGGWLLDIGDGSTVPFFAVLCVGALVISAAAFVIDRPIPPASKKA